jgi:hypothetical protein
VSHAAIDCNKRNYPPEAKHHKRSHTRSGARENMSFKQAAPTIVVGGKPAAQQDAADSKLEDENNNQNQATSDSSTVTTNRAHSQITLTNTSSELSSSDEIAHKFR